MEHGAVKRNLGEKDCSYFASFAFHRKFMGSANIFPMLRAPAKINASYITTGK